MPVFLAAADFYKQVIQRSEKGHDGFEAANKAQSQVLAAFIRRCFLRITFTS
jgi:hypothetical protein